MEPVKIVSSRTVVMPTTDIDTDQIIPARFLTTTSRDGLGQFAFHDLRLDSSGNSIPEFVLNKPEAKGCAVLVGGNNFGCGSSREHAPWALLDYGFRAVISTGIADIFRNNSLKNGLIPVVVDATTHKTLLDNPGMDVSIDIETCTECGGEVRIIASIEDPVVIRKILAHLGKKRALAGTRLLPDCRASPRRGLFV